MADEPDDEIRESVVRSNPRRDGEPAREWKRRLSRIMSRAVKRYWRDIEQIRNEVGTGTDEARRMYRYALRSIGAERTETTREEIVRVIAESLEEKADQVPSVSEQSLWTGDEYTWEFQNNYESYMVGRIPGGYHDYEATLWIYKGSKLLGRDDVVFGASPSEFFYNFHEAAREFLRDTLGDETPKGITFHVTEIRVLA